MAEAAIDTTKTATAPTVLKPTFKLHDGRLAEAGAVRMNYAASIPAGVALKEVLAPSCWAHFATKLKPQDLIEAFWEDGSQVAYLRVMFVGRAEAKVEVEYHKIFDQTSIADSYTDDYEVKWRGPGSKFAVVSRVNGAVIKDHLFPKSEAIAYLRDHLGRMRQ